jgi:predicted permease
MSLSPGLSSSALAWEEIYPTFLASVRSVGTACTLAGVGVYLHRRGFILGDGKRTLALISQQVTIPLLFFTKFIHCNQDWSTDPCPDVTQSIKDVWVLLIWPLYVVGMGLGVGYVMAKLSGTPNHQLRAVLVACGFGNSTGLPITLLTVVHANFPSTTDLGRVDPCLFLSVYLLVYPVLQWGIGGWLLAPPTTEKKTDRARRRRPSGLAHNVLNRKTDSFYKFTHRGIGETDASMYMSVQEDLNQYGEFQVQYSRVKPEEEPQTGASPEIGLDLTEEQDNIEEPEESPVNEVRTLLLYPEGIEKMEEYQESSGSDSHDDDYTEEETIIETVQKVAEKCLQPPVLGALLGLVVASLPKLRGLFVDLIDRNGDAPLEWFFDGLYSAGQAAVPINMIILGCNLNASYEKKSSQDTTGDAKFFSPQTTMAVVLGKMVVMPIIGFLSAFFFKTYFWDIPDGTYRCGAGSLLPLLKRILMPLANIRLLCFWVD